MLFLSNECENLHDNYYVTNTVTTIDSEHFAIVDST